MMLLHLWNDAATAGDALELMLVVVSTVAVVALHLWLTRLFGASGTGPGRPIRERFDHRAELRLQRRLRSGPRLYRAGSRGTIRSPD
jgi:hypothetical protein